MKKIVSLVLAAVLALGMFSVAAAEENPYANWPEKDVTVIYNTKAGSGGDTFLRQIIMALKEQDILNGHDILVENIVDNTGYAAWKNVRDAKTDGYTLGLSSPKLVTSYILNGVDLDYKDVTYIIGMGMDNQFLTARGDAPYNTLEEMIEYAKDHTINIATSSPSGQTLIGVLQIEAQTGVTFNKITYSSGSDQIVAMMGGFVDCCCMEYAETESMVSSGEFKLIASFGNERSVGDALKDVPTLKECGINFGIDRERGIFGPLDMDPQLVQRIYDIFVQAYENENFKNYMNQVLIDQRVMDGAEFFASYDDMARSYEANLEALTQG